MMIMLDCEQDDYDDELPDGASIVHPSPMRRACEPSQWESHLHRSGLQVCGQYVLKKYFVLTSHRVVRV